MGSRLALGVPLFRSSVTLPLRKLQRFLAGLVRVTPVLTLGRSAGPHGHTPSPCRDLLDPPHDVLHQSTV